MNLYLLSEFAVTKSFPCPSKPMCILRLTEKRNQDPSDLFSGIQTDQIASGIGILSAEKTHMSR